MRIYLIFRSFILFIFLCCTSLLHFSNTAIADPDDAQNTIVDFYKHLQGHDPVTSADSFVEEEAAYRKYLKADYPLLTRQQFPGMFSLLDKIIKRHQSSLQEILKENNRSEEIEVVYYIMGGNIGPNADVMAGKIRNGKRRIYITITANLLEVMLRDDIEANYYLEKIESRIPSIQGVIAHELGHYMDIIDAEGTDPNFLKNNTTQSIEARADATAVEIQIKSRFPANGLYQAFKKLHEWEKKFAPENYYGKRVSAFLSSHPLTMNRMMQQRIHLTVRRFLKGFPPESEHSKADSRIIGELYKLEQVEKDYSIFNFTGHETLEELISIFEREVGNKLEDKKNNSHAEIDLKRYIALQNEISVKMVKAKTKYEDPVTQRWIHQLVLILKNKYDFDTGPAHSRSGPLVSKNYYNNLKKIPLYQDRRFLEETLSKCGIFDKIDRWTFEHNPFYRNLLLPDGNTVLEVYEDKLLERIKEPLGDFLYGIQGLDESLKSINEKVYFSKIIQKSLSQLPTDQLYSQLTLLGNTSAAFFNFHSLNRRDSFEKYTNSIEIIIQTKLPEKTYKDLLEIAKMTWARKGELAYYHLLTNSRSSFVNWPLLFQVLGYTVGEGYKEVEKSLKAFILSDDFSKVCSHESFKKEISYSSSPLFQVWNNPQIQEKLKLQSEKIADIFEVSYKVTNIDTLNENAKLIVIKQLESNPQMNRESLKKTTVEAFKTLTKGRLDVESDGHRIQVFFYVDIIDKADISKNDKKRLLEDITLKGIFGKDSFFYRKYSSDADPWYFNENLRNKCFPILKRNGLVNGFSDLIHRSYSLSAEVDSTAIFNAIFYLRHEILDEILATKNTKELFAILTKLFKAKKGEGGFHLTDLTRTDDVQEFLKTILKQAKSFQLSTRDKVQLFRYLTASGGSRTMDDFFIKEILPALEEEDSAYQFDSRISHLFVKPTGVNRSRFSTENTKEKIVRSILQAKTKQKISFKSAFNAILRLMPTPSLQRDNLLEQTAWNYKLKDKNDLDKIQELKSTNWRLHNPTLVNKISGLSQVLGELEGDDRIDVIRYFMKPTAEIPTPLAKEIEKIALFGEKSFEELEYKEAKEKYYKTKAELTESVETLAWESQPPERLGIFEILLNVGQPPLCEEAGFPGKLFEKLGISLGIKNEKVVRAYLKATPVDEITPSIAYAIANRDSDDLSLSLLPVFEAFQAVGVKGGQLSSMLGIFGPEQSKKLEKLLDNAEAMQLAEIWAEINKLPSNEREQVEDIEEILGSASLKTVVKVRLKNGKKAALMIKRPNAEAVMQGHIKIAKKFLEELRKEGVQAPYGLLFSMLRGIESSMNKELDFRQEAVHYKMANDVFKKINTDMRNTQKSQKWKFRVPEVLDEIKPRENMLLVELVDGKSFKSFSANNKQKAQNKELGEIIGTAGFMSLFKYRFGSADPHPGNYLIDENNNTIYPIDFGQSIELTANSLEGDELRILARFLEALDKKRPTDIRRIGMSMVESGKLTTPKNLDRDLTFALNANKPLEQKIADIIEAFESNGVKLDSKYTFGILKALIYYKKPEYFSTQRYEQELKYWIKQTLLQSPKAYIQEQIESCVTRVIYGIPIFKK